MVSNLFGRFSPVLMVSLLAAGLSFSLSTTAATMAIDLDYEGVLFSNIHEAEATIFYDSADVTGAAQETVTLSGLNIRVRATWNGDNWTNWITFPNDQTSPCTLACGIYANRTPFTATFRNGIFGPVRFASMLGLQRSPAAPIENLVFGNDANDGDIAVFAYGRLVDGRLSDTVALTTISSPYVVVPLPPAAWLLGTCLLAVVRPRGAS